MGAMRHARIGAIYDDTPIADAWPYSGYPRAVSLLGTVFIRDDVFVFPSATIVHYREAICSGSRHVTVDTRTRRFRSTHVDEANPACGGLFLVRHLYRDVLPLAGKAITRGLTTAAAIIENEDDDFTFR